MQRQRASRQSISSNTSFIINQRIKIDIVNTCVWSYSSQHQSHQQKHICKHGLVFQLVLHWTLMICCPTYGGEDEKIEENNLILFRELKPKSSER